MSEPFAFPKGRRLVRRRQFQTTVDGGALRCGRYLMAHVAPVRGLSRLGITVTKRFGKAHDRNRFKRLVRESFRLLTPLLPPDLAIVVKARPHARSATFAAISAELRALLLAP